MIGKSRHGGTSSHQSEDGKQPLPSPGFPSDGEVDPEKENQYHSKYRLNSLTESSDDAFDLCKFHFKSTF